MMAGSPRLLRAFYRCYFALWIPTLAWAATWWPRSVMYWMARWLVIRPFIAVRPKYMAAVRANLSRVLAQPPHSREVGRTAREMMFQHAYHWIDFFRYSQWPAERLQAAVSEVEGQEHLQRARERRRGVLLLSAHMGNPEVGAFALGSHLEPVHVLYWRDRFATAEDFRTRMRLRGNVHGIPVDASPLSVIPALETLRSGGILAAHGDRDFNEQGWPATFFGASAWFPPGPFLLAARAGATIIPTFFLLEPDRRFRVIYEAPIEVSGEADYLDRAREAMERWVSILETRVLEHPEQWYCFYPFWPQQPSSGGSQPARLP